MSDDALFDISHDQFGNANFKDYAFAGKQDTSHAAAENVLPRTGTQRWRVYNALFHSDGMTDEELCDALDMAPNTQRPRRKELCDQDLVVDSGDRRPTSTGNSAIVWTVA